MQPDPHRTLGDLAADKMALVAICRHCRHRRVLYMPRLIERLGAQLPALELRDRLRCQSCRGLGADLHEVAR
jgi:hypothetical protein